MKQLRRRKWTNRLKTFGRFELADVKTALEANNFEVFFSGKKGGCLHKIVLEDLIPTIKAQDRILGRLHDVYRSRAFTKS